MNPIIALELASVVLIGTIAVVTPSVVNADGQWCFEPTEGEDILCFDPRKECKNQAEAFPTALKCFKFDKQ